MVEDPKFTAPGVQQLVAILDVLAKPRAHGTIETFGCTFSPDYIDDECDVKPAFTPKCARGSCFEHCYANFYFYDADLALGVWVRP